MEIAHNNNIDESPQRTHSTARYKFEQQIQRCVELAGMSSERAEHYSSEPGEDATLADRTHVLTVLNDGIVLGKLENEFVSQLLLQDWEMIGVILLGMQRDLEKLPLILDQALANGTINADKKTEILGIQALNLKAAVCVELQQKLQHS